MEKRQKRVRGCSFCFLLCVLFFCCISTTVNAGRVIDFQGVGVAAENVQQSVIEKMPSAALSSSKEIRVGLLLGQKNVLISSDKGFFIIDHLSGKEVMAVAPNAAIKIESGMAGILADGKPLLSTSFSLVPQQLSGIFQLGAAHYRGSLFFRVHDASFDVIEKLALDDYVAGVLAEEMPASWPMEALKAQAVAARTYALYHKDRHLSEGYDVCTTTHCQLYGGVDAETPTTRAAAEATAGQVLTYGGNFAETLFHSDSGGMTESREALWGDGVAYLEPVKEDVQKTMPWQVVFQENDFLKKLAASGNDIGSLQSVELSPLVIGRGDDYRTPSGRVSRMVIHGSRRKVTLTGSDVRSIFGLKSTLFAVKYEKGQVLFTGFGYGHGLGLSQYGAERLSHRLTYDAILAHYYPGTTLEILP